MKTIVYLTGGLGDLYPFLAVWPSLKENLKINDNDIEYYLNSGVILNKHLYPSLSKSILRLLQNGGIINFHLIAKENGSCIGTQFPEGLCGYTHRNGLDYQKIKNDFLFFRNAKLKSFMKKICNHNILIDSPMSERTYMWNNGEYTPLTFEIPTGSLIRNPVPSYPTTDEKHLIDTICDKKHLLIHVRVKANNSAINQFNDTISWCIDNDITPILIGLRNIETGLRSLESHNNESFVIKNDNIVDLMDNKLSLDGYFYLIQKATNMLTSSSGFSWHRIYCNETYYKTAYLWPESYGNWDANVCSDFRHDKKNTVINPELSDCTNHILTWLKEIYHE